jgi:nucleotide-binding universal stress UspA family protein
VRPAGVRTSGAAEDGALIAQIAADLATLKAQARTYGQRFKGMLDRQDVSGEWHVVAEAALSQLELRAKASDLVILGQHDPDEPAGLKHPEAVILACGRPALVVPYVGQFHQVGDNVLIAWNGSRESARAAHDALPLMPWSGAVTVLSVETEDAAMPLGSDLAGHLQRHGLKVTAERTVSDELSVADAILSRAADFGSDLIVMGAYGHSRLREWILGGATRDILRSMTVPVLMAH